MALLLAIAAAAMSFLEQYKSRPGEAGDAPSRWPVASRLSRTPALPTLTMFAHPMCPCTRASLGELRTLLAHFDGKVRTHVVFFAPDDVEGDWTKSDLWKTAAAMPNVEIVRDADRAEALLFGVKTSGQVVLYGADGGLLFAGGITRARGHAGANAGLDRLGSLLASLPADRATSAVFGCPLMEPAPGER